jgi:hypothetical protein
MLQALGGKPMYHFKISNAAGSGSGGEIVVDDFFAKPREEAAGGARSHKPAGASWQPNCPKR